MFPIPVRRGEGVVEVTLACGFCGAGVPVRVLDVRTTRRKRAWWLALGLGLVAAAVVGTVAGRFDSPGYAVPGIAVAYVGLWLRYLDDGVRIEGEYLFQPYNRRGHSIRSADFGREHHEPERADRPAR